MSKMAQIFPQVVTLSLRTFLFISTIGVNISERKTGTERTKKRKKRYLVCLSHRQGAQRSISPIYFAIHGFCPSYDNPGYLYPGPYAVRTKSQLNKQAKHTTFYKFEEGISFAEHWKLVAESPEFHLTRIGPTRRMPVQRAALCIRNFPSQYRTHFRGLSGHNAGRFNATVFISMLTGGELAFPLIAWQPLTRHC